MLADGDGKLLMEQGNGFTSEGRDRTAHAERLLASQGGARLRPRVPRALHALYLRRALRDVLGRDLLGRGSAASSTARPRRRLKAQTGAHEDNPTLDLPCDIVFKAGQRPTEVVGPLLEDEAAALQADFWKRRG